MGGGGGGEERGDVAERKGKMRMVGRNNNLKRRVGGDCDAIVGFRDYCRLFIESEMA